MNESIAISEIKNIILFGWGRQGKKVYNSLSDKFNIVSIIDNSIDKQGVTVENLTINSLDSIREIDKDTIILVCCQEYFYLEIKKQLKSKGYIENIDFMSSQSFISEWFWTMKQELFVLKTDIPVTSRCTLKCENCMISVPYCKNQEDISIEDIKNDLRLYFENVDYVMDMDIVGGEPFLYSKLSELFEIFIPYRKKIGYLGVITNGTIIPKKELIDSLKKYDIGVSISDYSSTIDYEEKVDKLCAILQENHIDYMRNSNIQWFDFGLNSNRYSYEGKKLEAHYKLCKSTCHILNNNRLYYCSVDFGMQWAEIIEQDRNSYCELSIYSNSNNNKMKIMNFIEGKNIKSIPKFCSRCGGFGIDNNNKIETAIQISM